MCCDRYTARWIEIETAKSPKTSLVIDIKQAKPFEYFRTRRGRTPHHIGGVKVRSASIPMPIIEATERMVNRLMANRTAGAQELERAREKDWRRTMILGFQLGWSARLQLFCRGAKKKVAGPFRFLIRLGGRRSWFSAGRRLLWLKLPRFPCRSFCRNLAHRRHSGHLIALLSEKPASGLGRIRTDPQGAGTGQAKYAFRSVTGGRRQEHRWRVPWPCKSFFA